MKSNVIVGFETCTLSALDALAGEKGVSRASLIRTAVSEYLGVPEPETAQKSAPAKKYRAYAGGQYLGTFPSAEAAEQAKRDATRQTFYYVAHNDLDGLLHFEVLDDPGEHDMYLQIEVFAHHAARRRYWETLAENHSGGFKNTPEVWEKIREFWGKEIARSTSQGCVVRVVVA